MIEQTGVVIEIDGAVAVVETQRQGSCGSCSARAGCGTALLNRSVGKRFSRVRVANTIHAEPGECVVLGIPEQALLKGSFAVYLVPLVGLLLGGVILPELAGATAAGWSDILAFLGGGAGFLLGLSWVRGYGQHAGRRALFQPVLLRRAITDSVVESSRPEKYL
ncbi:MAG: SoxR-reducing system protein RseC [Gammaproteobacteria bacterium]